MRDARLARGYSLRAFAKKAGFSPSFLSQVELGQTSPSLDSLGRLSAALDLSVVDMLSLSEMRREVDIMEPDSKGDVVEEWDGGRLRHFLPVHLGPPYSVLVLDLTPGFSTPLRLARRSMRELGIVLHGNVVCTVGESQYPLKTGSGIYLDLAMPHRWANHAKQPARVLLINPNFTVVTEVTPESDKQRGKHNNRKKTRA